jgi:hypothetical protein
MTYLRKRLHEAVDEIIDDVTSPQRDSASPAPIHSAEHVDRLGAVGSFIFHWPADYGSEQFESGNAYRPASLSDQSSVIVGWTTRRAWGRDRRRAVVFHRMRAGDAPKRWYPWTEFVETDNGKFAASIPNPDRPRAMLKEGADLPARFIDRATARSDEVFDSIRDGASLRLVVDESEEPEMVRHGLWVAKLRRRV